jgi:NAD(P)-dependent dehydrogenase (short-subunit alcohol dehydrogenase family)
MDIASAKAVISGGASGLGLATARCVIEAGGHAALLDVNEEEGTKKAEELGERAVFLSTDVSDEDGVRASINNAAEFMDGITLAVNCAGVLIPERVLGRAGTASAASFSKVVQINLVGSFNVTKEAAAVMEANEPNADGERGVVVSTASVAAYEGQIGQASYSASKGGIVGMMLPIARELARFGIRVNTIAPGIFMTPMMAGLPEEVQQSLGAQVPFPPRLGRPEEFADLVASIYGNAMINGETIRLDGGIRMQPK